MLTVCPRCGAVIEHDRSIHGQGLRQVEDKATGQPYFTVNGEVVHQCEQFSGNGR